MRGLSQERLLLLAAAYLRLPARRLRALLRGEDPALAEWVGGDAGRKVAHARHQAKEAALRLEHLGARLVTMLDDEYPKGLHDLEEAPAFLCVRGRLPQGGLAIVGSRSAPEPALRFARELAGACDMPVVSGLALGVDAAAHRGACAQRRPTLAYVATGLGATYPPQHAGLEEEIIASGGAVATERLPAEPVTKWALLHRDRLQAAHACATLLVCSELDGGAMQTMRFAAVLGRPRFVLDLQGSEDAAGNLHAARAGAIVVPREAGAALRIIHRTLDQGTHAAANVHPPHAAR